MQSHFPALIALRKLGVGVEGDALVAPAFAIALAHGVNSEKVAAFRSAELDIPDRDQVRAFGLSN
ncbi:hypothetical protein D3C75_1302260 [compost metagenome]